MSAFEAFERDVLRRVCNVLDNCARDRHGVYYTPQRVLQDIANATGRAAPDAARFKVATGDVSRYFADERTARACAEAHGGRVEVLP